MDEATAKQIAGNARPAHDVPASYALRGAERRIIEITDGGSGIGALVRFQAGVAWAELAVDESTGTVARVQRSRA